MTHDEMIAVIQAQKDGQKIQWRLKGAANWREDYEDASGPAFNFYSNEYRIKPKSRDWWIDFIRDGKNERIAKVSNKQFPGSIHVREVPDE